MNIKKTDKNKPNFKILYQQTFHNLKSRWLYILILIILNSLFCYSLTKTSYIVDETLRNYIIISTLIILISVSTNNIIIQGFTQIFISALYSYLYIECYTIGTLVKFNRFTTISLNFLIYFTIIFIIFILSKKILLSIGISQFFWIIVGYTSYFLKKVRGTPLFFSDIFSVKTALDVSGQYHFTIEPWTIYQIIALFAVPFLLYFTVKKSNAIKKEFSILTRSIAFVIVALFLICVYNEKDLTSAGLELSYWEHKTSTGFLCNMILEAENYGIKKDESYSLERLEEIKKENTLPKTNTNDIPDIICIMNESFSDLNVIGPFDTNDNPLKFLDSLKQEKNCIDGNLYVSVKGGNTANTEFEFLTGSTTAAFNYGMIPYSNYIRNSINTNVSMVEKSGYNTLAFHPWKKSGWNRPNVYKFMDFDKMFFIEDLDRNEIDNLRAYPSDLYNYSMVEDYYNKMDTSPRFIMNITMQNHGGYDDKAFNSNIYITNTEYKDKMPRTDQYLSLISYSDSALKSLIDYYRTVDRKVIICFFGDHQPAVEKNFFKQVAGGDENTLTQEEIENQYITPFVIWANYDIPKAHIDKMSANYLFAYMAKTAGLNLSPYQNYLLKLYEKYPVISGVGAISKDDVYYTPDQMDELDDIKEYYNLIYNQISDTDNLIQNFFD